LKPDFGVAEQRLSAGFASAEIGFLNAQSNIKWLIVPSSLPSSSTKRRYSSPEANCAITMSGAGKVPFRSPT